MSKTIDKKKYLQKDSKAWETDSDLKGEFRRNYWDFRGFWLELEGEKILRVGNTDRTHPAAVLQHPHQL
ncbi:hypothetical protein KQX54_011530 [Cotesia glomerata]|uniref:Uncharacterized protein n=1 Tax=Cotesia glomerata TaxID=32391 RepID=A0AAV7IWD7_COTGL|nr:hypothetical protein KQX54_011530 [Cotesia glomerata]